jgi:hypothetical protein
MLFVCFPPLNLEASTNSLEGHTFIAENDNFELFLREEGLSIILRSKSTGAIVRSAPNDLDGSDNEAWQNFMLSAVTIEYMVNAGPNTARFTLFTDGMETNVRTLPDGFSADAVLTLEKRPPIQERTDGRGAALVDRDAATEDEEVFDTTWGPDETPQQIGLTLIVRLTDDGITAEVLNESIVDAQMDGYHKLTNVYIYPLLGATRLDETEGYMFIPDGSGSLMRLADRTGMGMSPYVGRIFGGNLGADPFLIGAMMMMYGARPIVNDTLDVAVPVFGIIRTEENLAVMGIIEEGYTNAWITAYPAGVTTQYNWISPIFGMRDSFVQPTGILSGAGVVSYTREINSNDIRLRYVILEGEQANYSAMANYYRNFLLDSGRLVSQNRDFQIHLDVIGAENERFLVFNRVLPMTTISQLESMITHLTDEGVENMLITYKGWQRGGLSGGFPITNHRIERNLGRTQDLVNLIEMTRGTGIDFSLYDNLLIANPDRRFNTNRDIVRRLDRRILELQNFQRRFPFYNLITPGFAGRIMDSGRGFFNDLGLETLTIGGIGDNLFSFFYNDEVVDREETMNKYVSLVSDMSESRRIIMNQPNKYFWGEINGALGMPVNTSRFSFIEYEIPFLGMVLSGTMPVFGSHANLTPNSDLYFLKLKESGFFPSFVLTYEGTNDLLNTNSSHIFTSRFDDHKDNIIDWYFRLRDFHNDTAGAVIIYHEILERDVTRVVYDNGTEILFNFTRTERTVGDITLAPLSYRRIS